MVSSPLLLACRRRLLRRLVPTRLRLVRILSSGEEWLPAKVARRRRARVEEVMAGLILLMKGAAEKVTIHHPQTLMRLLEMTLPVMMLLMAEAKTAEAMIVVEAVLLRLLEAVVVPLVAPAPVAVLLETAPRAPPALLWPQLWQLTLHLAGQWLYGREGPTLQVGQYFTA